MGDVKVKLNTKSVREIMQSEAVGRDLQRRAEAIATAAGVGMEVRRSVTGSRQRATVVTTTVEAMRRESQSHALSRALDAGRG